MAVNATESTTQSKILVEVPAAAPSLQQLVLHLQLSDQKQTGVF